jgi:hypothetical protein
MAGRSCPSRITICKISCTSRGTLPDGPPARVRRSQIVAGQLCFWDTGEVYKVKVHARARRAVFHQPLHQEDCDFLHSFQSPMVAAAMSLTAVRSHLPERLLRSATIRAAALGAPRWTFAVSQAIA